MAVEVENYYSYTLAYPDDFVLSGGQDLSNIVFYCGMGKGGRIDDHEREANTRCLCLKCSVIRSIWDAGRMIQKNIIFESYDKQTVLRFEKESIITRFSSPYLLNSNYNRYHELGGSQVRLATPANGEHYRISGQAQAVLTRWSKEYNLTREAILTRLILYGCIPEVGKDCKL